MGARHQILQHQPRETEHRARPLQIRDGAGQILSPYLTAKEAVTYLKLHSLSALYRHIKENRLPSLRRGRTRLFDVRDLDMWLRDGR